jgi:hypothetical protein
MLRRSRARTATWRGLARSQSKPHGPIRVIACTPATLDTRDMTSEEQRWEAWNRRLREFRGKVVTLPREVTARPHDDNLVLLWLEPNLVLAAGTRVRFEETRYDAMRLDEAHHCVKVESGPAAGRWASIGDTVSPRQLRWEE